MTVPVTDTTPNNSADDDLEQQPNEAVVETVEEADEEEDEHDDDDDVTVIVLDQRPGHDDLPTVLGPAAFDWNNGPPELAERRRNILVQELRRVQRSSFIHFAILCLIPTLLLTLVLATVLGDVEECDSNASFCQLEPRTFMNAFTTRCICETVAVGSNSFYNGDNP